MTRFAHEPDEDTIEMELTGAQELGLSQAAKGAQATAQPVEWTAVSLSPALRSLVHRRTARIDFVCGLTLAAAAVGLTAATAWRAADGSPPAPAAISTGSIVRPPAAPAEPQGPPVQVRNPFDATEVFEFPAETTKTEAREAMAERLLQRARDRRGQGVSIKHAGSRHLARDAADERPDVFVTKLSGQPSSPNRR